MDKLVTQDSIYSQGYGVLAKTVMKAKGLSIEAKGIYAYIISYAGAGETAFPPRGLICSDLGISKTRFYTHFKQLLASGHMKVHQEKGATGKFRHNVYTIVTKPCPSFPDTGNPDTGNEDTNINSPKTNSLKSIRDNDNGRNQTVSTRFLLDTYEGLYKEELGTGIPYYYERYKAHVGKPHPRLKVKQLERIYDVLECAIARHDWDTEAFLDAIDRWFTKNIRTDYNINHFATEGVLDNLAYEAA